MEIYIYLIAAIIFFSGSIYVYRTYKEINRLLIRNQELYHYLIRIIKEHPDVYSTFPSYDEMLYSNKPLEDKYWFPKDKIAL